MDHDYIRYLRDHNPTVRLLKLDNAPLIIGFLFHEFKKNNRTVISSTGLTMNLADYLFSLRQRHGEDWYPGSARGYLTAWTNDGFLRKFYPADSQYAVRKIQLALSLDDAKSAS